MKDLGKFLLSRVFFTNLILAVIATIMIVFMFTCGLESYTHHGEKITVRPLVGRSLAEVEELLKANKLQYVVSDTSYHSDYEPWAVLAQNPKAGALVKENRTIYLTINSDQPPLAALPDVIYKSVRDATTRLNKYGFKVKEVTYRPTQEVSGRDGNYVLEALIDGKPIKAGALLNKGASVTLVASSGSTGDNTEAPCLLGKTVSDAQWLVSTYQLNLGVFVPADDAELGLEYDDTLNAYIYKQVPEPGTEMSVGSPIDIWITHEALDTVNLCEVAPIDSLDYYSTDTTGL